LDDKLRPEWIDEVRYLFGPHVQRRLAALNKVFGELMESLNSKDERLKRQLDGLGEEGRG
jgi:hypothetical protein